MLIIVLFIISIAVKHGRKPKYYLKEKLLTQTEEQYYNLIREILGGDYLVLPQINLASVIDKKGGNGNFRNELFRNIDFGVFTRDFTPLFLIEINDNSHFRKDRKERDEKVEYICKKAKVELVTFWVKDGIDYNKIKKTLLTALRKSL